MTTPQELAYYLQGFFEITDAKVLTIDQVKKIKDKVSSCFEKITTKPKTFKGHDAEYWLENYVGPDPTPYPPCFAGVNKIPLVEGKISVPDYGKLENVPGFQNSNPNSKFQIPRSI